MVVAMLLLLFFLFPLIYIYIWLAVFLLTTPFAISKPRMCGVLFRLYRRVVVVLLPSRSYSEQDWRVPLRKTQLICESATWGKSVQEKTHILPYLYWSFDISTTKRCSFCRAYTVARQRDQISNKQTITCCQRHKKFLFTLESFCDTTQDQDEI